MENYFEDVCKVIDRASNNRTKAVSMKNLKTLLLFGVLMNNYRKEIIAVNPPDFIVKSLGNIAKILGVDYNKNR
jgi:hypothetical protein